MEKRRTERRKRISGSFWIYAAAALMVLGFLIIRIIPEKTDLVIREDHAFTENVKCYLFLNDEYAVLTSDQRIDFLVPEGTKISATTLISDNYTVDSAGYISDRVKIIDYLLENPSLTPRELYNGIVTSGRKASEYEMAMDAALDDGDSEQAGMYADMLEKEQEHIYIMKKALQHIYTQSWALSEMRERYISMAGTSLPLNADSLGFDILGFIDYSLDGYENVMHMDRLDTLDSVYLSYLDSFRPQTSSSDGTYHVKSTSIAEGVLVLRLPAETPVAGEETALLRYQSLCDSYNMDDEGGYFSFIYRRMDILDSFPSLRLYTASGDEVTGKLVKVSTEGEEKLLYVALRAGIREISRQRIFTGSLVTEEHDCYIVDRGCIYEDDGRYFVNALSGSSVKDPVQVKVYRYEGGKAYLRVEDNPLLEEGMEIVSKGRKVKK